MKKTFFTLLLFFMSGVAALSAQNAVDYPSYRNHANYIEVYHVETNPEYTLFETTVYNKPGYWIQMNSTDQLVGCQTGKKYRFLRVEGFEMDKQVFMPESGCRSFKIYFEPLDIQDKAIHWIENGKDTVFSTLNIRPVARPKGMFSCRIKGEVAGNKPCVRLLLADPFEDMRIISPLSIPVKDNKFDYTYYTNQPEVKKLIQWEEYSNGRWYNHPVFMEAGENEVIIEEKSRFLKIKQGTPANVDWVELENKRQQEREAAGINQLNKELASIPESERFSSEGKKLYERVMVLNKNKDFTDEIAAEQKAIFEKISTLEKSKSLYSKKYYDLMDEINSRGKKVNQRFFQYIAQQPSLPNLYALYESIQMHIQQQNDEYLKEYEIYRKNFAKKWGKSSIGQHLESMVKAQLQMKVGQPYKNYNAEDFTGKRVSISEQIKGKWALIDLWASWCGPCRAKGRQMIPVYEQYKGSGFTIVGIARETKISDVQQALKKEKYPWMQLVEINDKNKIWLKHGIENAGGATFLIDDKGIIVAINPKADEVKKILEKQLKK